MHSIRRFTVLLVLPLLFVACGKDHDGPSQSEPSQEAAELAVVTSGGFTAAYRLLAPRFEEKTGIRLVTSYGASTGGGPNSIPVRLARGEKFDLIILSRSSLDNLTDEGFVDAASRTDLVRSMIGMAVQEGAPIPDIGTAEKFIALLREAESIGYSASASGTYLSMDLFPRLGLWEALEEKSTRVVGDRVASVVARGEVEIGFQQISEILPIEGASFAGPIPDEFQKVTTFSAGIPVDSSQAELAADLIAFFASGEVAETIRLTGLAPVIDERSP